MDKICQSSGESNSDTNATATATTHHHHYLNHLNKLSHKISKQPTIATTTTAPLLKKPTTYDHQNPNQPIQSQQSLQQQQQQQPPPHQPPVYNINKNDFRDVVQKLTGSPAHDRFSTPPPIHQPKPPSSRLQRIRPPPLAHVSNRPPSMLSCADPPVPPPNTTAATTTTNNSISFIQRPTAPLSPLPPFPSVHPAAESPVSAYMRYLQNSFSTADPNSKLQFSGFSPLAPLVSPRWSNFNATTSQQQQMIPPPPASQPHFQPPSSPLPFGCLNSPRSSHHLLSPSLLFSPSSGQLNFPLSPTVPVLSPRWRAL